MQRRCSEVEGILGRNPRFQCSRCLNEMPAGRAEDSGVEESMYVDMEHVDRAETVTGCCYL